MPVARGVGVLGPFLVVEHDVDGDPGAVRPPHLRDVAAVADVVSLRAGNVLIDERFEVPWLDLLGVGLG